MNKTIIIGSMYAQRFGKALAQQGFNVIYISENVRVDKRLAFHADLSIISLQNGKAVAAPYLIQNGQLSGLSCEIISAQGVQGNTYPRDIPLCACVAGKFLICNKAHTDESVLQNFDGEIIDVKQGYANCSVCSLPDGAIISADDGIIASASGRGVEALKIETGYVDLDGFDAGFIGGASFCVDNTLYFFGDVSKHPSFAQIRTFTKAHGVSIHSLTSDGLTDIGGAAVI